MEAGREGIEVVATGTKKSTQADKARIQEIMGDDAMMLDSGGARNLLDVAYNHHADIMIAGGRNMYTALKAKMPFLDINQEREHAYAGYEGMITLAEELKRTLTSPIWRHVNSIPVWRQTRDDVVLNMLDVQFSMKEVM